jgi:hypothetical protein
MIVNKEQIRLKDIERFRIEIGRIESILNFLSKASQLPGYDYILEDITAVKRSSFYRLLNSKDLNEILQNQALFQKATFFLEYAENYKRKLIELRKKLSELESKNGL